VGFERNGRLIEGAAIQVPGIESEGWTLIVDQPDGVAVALDLRAASREGAVVV
jgi:hypothetical protein